MDNFSFEESGELVSGGKYRCSGEAFINAFCKGPNRQDYESAIINIFDFAKEKGARRIFFGGSFITLKEVPHGEKQDKTEASTCKIQCYKNLIFN